MSNDKFEINGELDESLLVGENNETHAEVKETLAEAETLTKTQSQVEKKGKKAQKEQKNTKSVSDTKAKEKKATLLAVLGIILFVVAVFGYLGYSTLQSMQEEAPIATASNNSTQEVPYSPPPEEGQGAQENMDAQGIQALHQEETSTLTKENSEVLAQDALVGHKTKAVVLGESNSEKAVGDKNVPQGVKEARTASVEMEEVGVENSNIHVSAKENIPSAEKEIMGLTKPIKAKQGGVCDLSIKYKLHLEYIPYRKIDNQYIPAFKLGSWDKKGMKLSRRVVVLGHDKKHRFTEIEKGIYLPSEMFSQCSSYEKAGDS